MFTLRPYQQEAIAAVQRDWAAGLTDVLVTAATGTGKTEMFLALLADELQRQPRARALLLCHRRELIEQPLERLALRFPDLALKAGIVMAERDECDRQIVAATVQTLADPARLDALLRHGAMDYLIRDEAHRAVTPTDMAIFERLRFANPGMKHLGVTATPIRADGKGLRAVYQKESFHYGIREAVKGGALVPPKWLAIQTGISLAKVSQHDGDYSASSLADVYETANCFDLVVESHRKYADGRQAMAFTPSVAGAYDLAQRFTDAGYPAGAADGTTGKRDRAEVLRDFRAGRLAVLVNCMLWTEGIDVPNVSCIHQVRPTKSDGAYVQMIGRGLRAAPGKSDCVILDYAPVEARNIVMLGDVLGVDARKDVYIEEVAEGEVAGGLTFDGAIKWLTGNPMELVSRELDYLDLNPFAWHRQGGWLTLGLGEASDGVDRALAIQVGEGSCVLWGVAKRDGAATIVARLCEGDLADVTDEADALIAKHANALLAAKGKQWRKQPPSDAQAAFGKRLGVWQAGISKGDLAAAITHKLTVSEIERQVRRGSVLVRATVPAAECAA